MERQTFLQKSKFYIVLIIAILALIFAGYQWWRAYTVQNLADSYKTHILKQDSLIQVQDGQYKKLVNDMKSQGELMDILKDQNKDLFNTIKDQKKEIVALISLQQSFEKKVDTVYVKTDGSFTDFYPDKDDWFVQYESKVVTDSTRVGSWDFGEIDIDITISEKQPGLFEADLGGPSFLKLNSLEVNSLPLENIKPDNFGWLLGGSLQYNLLDQTPQVDIYGGIRFKKTNLFIKAGTDVSVGAGIMQEF